MVNTLKFLLKELIGNDLDINNYPAQVLVLREMLDFDAALQKSIKTNSLLTYKTELTNKLKQFTSFRDQGSYLDKLKLKSLILDLIHNIAVVDELLNARVNSLETWD